MKKSALAITLSLIILSAAASVFVVQTVEAPSKTVYVDDDNVSGPWDGTPQHPYQNISSALKHAFVNDVIFVYNGTYYERVHVNKSVSLVGENRHGTIIDGNFTGTVVVITADNVNITNFTIRNGARMDDGITLMGSKACSIRDNIITSNVWGGIVLYSSNGNTLTNNTILVRYIGILLSDSNYNVLSHNKVRLNRFGIRLANSSNNTIMANHVFNNTLWGIYIASYTGPGSNNHIYHNNFVNDALELPIQNRSNALEGNSTNIWDNGYPSGGNYWSNYTGLDLYSGPYQNVTGSDGICDTPHVIPKMVYSIIIPETNNQDSYPLTEPWSPPTMIKTLIRTVRFWNLNKGTENSLTSKLKGGLHLLEMGNEDGAIHKLMIFINKVEALKGKKLVNDKADQLITEAQRIIDLI